jgi:hypothetical protein
MQHTFLPTTEKKFHRKRMKNDEIRAFFERQILIGQPNISNYPNKRQKSCTFFVSLPKVNKEKILM